MMSQYIMHIRVSLDAMPISIEGPVGDLMFMFKPFQL